QEYVSWSVHTKTRTQKTPQQLPGQISMFYDESDSDDVKQEAEPASIPAPVGSLSPIEELATKAVPSNSTTSSSSHKVETPTDNSPTNSGETETVDDSYYDIDAIDREDVIRFINEQGYLTYMVKDVRINSYLKSLLSLAGLLTHNVIYQ
ncbi:MAG TPA: hypothetical protein PLE82_06845, partial [Saccharofermentans sp.]|nr:hypothetical protein [Saccharofermentans sp.]